MKTIGMIGGMSWTSTISYYARMNREVGRRLGGHHSARCLLYSVDFDPMEENMRSGDWDGNIAILSEAAKSLERAGADLAMICTNTMHKLFGEVQAATPNLPFIHIADAAGAAIRARNFDKILLLGTKYTMEQDFYSGRLAAQGIETMVPEAAERERINDIIFDELCLDIQREESRAAMLDIIARQKALGAQGVVLGCTELGLLINAENSPLAVFDTVELHADMAVELALR